MKTKITVIAAVLLLSLTGCSTTITDTKGETQYEDDIYTFYQDLPDGTQVLCINLDGGYNGGISCDWAHKTVDIGEGK